jgi:hypothetical protein
MITVQNQKLLEFYKKMYGAENVTMIIPVIKKRIPVVIVPLPEDVDPKGESELVKGSEISKKSTKKVSKKLNN